MRNKRIIIKGLLIGLLIFITIYYIALYYIDQNKVSQFLIEIKRKTDGNISYSDINYADLIKIRDSVVSALDVKIDNLGQRSIWGFRVSRIITKRSGQCGEVTRLLINIFHKLNIPSRRVTLFGINFMHAVIEASIDGQWVIVDTVNGPDGFKKIISNKPSSIADHFQKTLGVKTYAFNVSKELNKFDIIYFSYFFNTNSILFKYFGLHVFIVKPLPVWIYFLFENPPLFAAWISFIVLIIISVFILFQKKRIE